MGRNGNPTKGLIMADVIAVVSDLIFSTKISGTARAIGFEANTVTTSQALSSALDAGDVRLVIVDMSLAKGEAPAALRCGASHASRPKTVAFYSHVQSELKEAAERAGADLIMARSKFNEQLPQLLRQYCAGTD